MPGLVDDARGVELSRQEIGLGVALRLERSGEVAM